MAELIAVVGEAGSGKSTSLRNLNPETTFIINVAGKNLPIRGFRSKYKPLTQNPDKSFNGNLFTTANVEKIAQVMNIVNNLKHIKALVIDDAQYIMSFEAMDKASEKGYEKFTRMASNFYSVLRNAMNMRDDLKVILLQHSENAGDPLNPRMKIKTIGKMIDSMITLEGLFTYVLFTSQDTDEEGNIRYRFITNSDGSNTAKTPMGCFESLYIDNDLDYVIKAIDEYNNGQ